MKINIAILVILASLLSACASQSMRAPCDQYATFCGAKIKINH